MGEVNTIGGMKIVVRAPNWIGDAVLSLPALASLPLNFPKAEIWVCAAEWTKGIFDPLDWIDGTISLSDKNNLKQPGRFYTLRSYAVGKNFFGVIWRATPAK